MARKIYSAAADPAAFGVELGQARIFLYLRFNGTELKRTVQADGLGVCREVPRRAADIESLIRMPLPRCT